MKLSVMVYVCSSVKANVSMETFEKWTFSQATVKETEYEVSMMGNQCSYCEYLKPWGDLFVKIHTVLDHQEFYIGDIRNFC